MSAFYWVGMAMNWMGQGSTIVWRMRNDDRAFLAALTAAVLVRMLVHVFLVMYHFKRNVREYFGLQSLSMFKAIALLVAIGIGLGVALGFAMFIYTISSR